jgi:hypothetical protein
MKIVVTTNDSSKFAGDVLKIIIDSAEIRFEMRGRERLIFTKENYNDQRFEQVQNYLKNVNVSSPAIAFINIPRGTVSIDATDDAKTLYKSIIGTANSVQSERPSAPLIDGKFTQEPQGNVAHLDKNVLDQYTR